MKSLIFGLILSITCSNAKEIKLSEVKSEKVDIVKIMKLDGSFETLLLGGSGAHGGDFIEMPIHNLGWKIYDILKKEDISRELLGAYAKKLEVINIKVVDSISLNERERGAVNTPDSVTLYITEKTYNDILNEEIPFKRRAQFFLHEFLPMTGRLDRNYRESNAFTEFLSNTSDNKIVDSYKSLLYSHDFEDGVGVSADEIKKVCEKFKRKNNKYYFATYCIYKSRFASGKSLISGANYGIKVFGIRPLSKDMRRTLIDYQSVGMSPYRSAARAKYACKSIITEFDDESFDFYKADCEIIKHKDEYYFNVTTLNPYSEFKKIKN